MAEMAYTLESGKAGLNPKSTPLLAVQIWAGSLTSLGLIFLIGEGLGVRESRPQPQVVFMTRTVVGASGQSLASSPPMP